MAIMNPPCAAASYPITEDERFVTGWRSRSEMLPLRWSQVDLAGGFVRLEPGTTKNMETRLPLIPELRALLEHRQAITRRCERAQGRIIAQEVRVRPDRARLNPSPHRARECAGIGPSGPEVGTIWAQVTNATSAPRRRMRHGILHRLVDDSQPRSAGATARRRCRDDATERIQGRDLGPVLSELHQGIGRRGEGR